MQSDQSPAARLLALATERLETLEAATLALRKHAAMYRNPLLERPELALEIANLLQCCLDAEKRWQSQQDALRDEWIAGFGAAAKGGDSAALPKLIETLRALTQLAQREKEAEAEYDAAIRDREQAKAEMQARLAT